MYGLAGCVNYAGSPEEFGCFRSVMGYEEVSI